jgi:hypothetical protein
VTPRGTNEATAARGPAPGESLREDHVTAGGGTRRITATSVKSGGRATDRGEGLRDQDYAGYSVPSAFFHILAEKDALDHARDVHLDALVRLAHHT